MGRPFGLPIFDLILMHTGRKIQFTIINYKISMILSKESAT